MKWLRLLLPAIVLAACALPAQAQLFSRKPRLANLSLPELIMTVKTDTDERKRIAALEQLRDQDIKAHPEILPVLIDVLLSDPKSGVRLEAIQNLSRLRPLSQTAGQALQQAAQQDENLRVRWQAKTTLWLQGYHPGNQDGQNTTPTGPTTKEPPLANAQQIIIVNPPVAVTPAQPAAQPLPLPGTATPGAVPVYGPPTTNPAPPTGLTRPLPAGTTVSLPRPMPSRPQAGFSTATPQTPATRVTPPPVPDDGPTIIPAP